MPTIRCPEVIGISELPDMGAGKQTQVFYKSSICPYPLYYLCRPYIPVLLKFWHDVEHVISQALFYLAVKWNCCRVIVINK